MAIWCDKPDLVTEDVITEDISKELRSLASKAWNTSSNKIADINEFRENYKKLGNVAAFEKGTSLPEVQPVKELVELNYDELNELIEKAEGLKAEDYTEESFGNLNKVLEEAKSLIGTVNSQEEINSMVNKLNDSINNLEGKGNGNSGENVPNSSEKPGISNKPGKGDSNNSGVLPQTGIESGLWGMIAIASIILGALLIYRRSNKTI